MCTRIDMDGLERARRVVVVCMDSESRSSTELFLVFLGRPARRVAARKFSAC